jgi:hypothetical protein
MISFNATVKSVKADVAKKVVSVSLTFEMSDETMSVAEALASNKMPVGVVVTPKQLNMLDLEGDTDAE